MASSSPLCDLGNQNDADCPGDEQTNFRKRDHRSVIPGYLRAEKMFHEQRVQVRQHTKDGESEEGVGGVVPAHPPFSNLAAMLEIRAEPPQCWQEAHDTGERLRKNSACGPKPQPDERCSKRDSQERLNNLH